MVTKGKPTARSQSYKAILQIQDKIKPTPTTSGNDAFPSPGPISTPVTHDEGAQRIIDTITVLHQSLDLVVSPNPHGHALVKLLGQHFSDLVRLYQKADNRTIVLQ